MHSSNTMSSGPYIEYMTNWVQDNLARHYFIPHDFKEILIAMLVERLWPS